MYVLTIPFLVNIVGEYRSLNDSSRSDCLSQYVGT
jgi:hypothetical protein